MSTRFEVSHATWAAPDAAANEDAVISGPRFAVVLDGATRPSGVTDTGCVHDVSWFVAQLSGRLAYWLLTSDRRLPEALAYAIDDVYALHAGPCDLRNPDSPSSTVAILRLREATVDYLVLADSPMVLRERAGDLRVVADDRIDRLPDYRLETVREARNVPDGFWVASTNPQAAYEAVVGSYAAETLDCAGLFSDGASRLAERYGMLWARLLELLVADGPRGVLERVRTEDADAEGTLPGKTFDDATAVLCRF